MKLTVLLDGEPTWDESTVADAIRAIVEQEVDKMVRKQVKLELSACEAEIAAAARRYADRRAKAAFAAMEKL